MSNPVAKGGFINLCDAKSLPKSRIHEICFVHKKLVVLGFNATLTAKVISRRSMLRMCFRAFSHQY